MAAAIPADRNDCLICRAVEVNDDRMRMCVIRCFVRASAPGAFHAVGKSRINNISAVHCMGACI
jgi:hypothetical protein